ncbi:hypothetical protein Tco_1004209 [Tanacetum coccineum]|uniref:Uncharacterized protein n=1 Tax=Tanacetum coccineum TaxID=301880 RepID=A0ABQ5FB97_9ASTR
MKKSYCPLKHSKVFPAFSTTNELFQASHDSSILQLSIDGFDHDASPLLIQAGPLPTPYGFVIPQVLSS